MAPAAAKTAIRQSLPVTTAFPCPLARIIVEFPAIDI
jgi:hypothetical protein